MTPPNSDKHTERRSRRLAAIHKADTYFQIMGLAFVTPLCKAIAGDNPLQQLKHVWVLAGIPLLAIVLFLLGWHAVAPQVQTSLGTIPNPAQVWEQVGTLHQDYVREQEREAAFYARQEARNAKLIAQGQSDRVKQRSYTGKPTFYSQIWTSIQTVFFGFGWSCCWQYRLALLPGYPRWHMRR